MIRPRPLFARCPVPACPIVVCHGGQGRGDAGLVLGEHVANLHPELLYGSAEVERRRLAADAHGRRN